MSEKKALVLDDGRIESIQYQSPEQLYEDLILRVKKYHPSDDISLIGRDTSGVKVINLEENTYVASLAKVRDMEGSEEDSEESEYAENVEETEETTEE